MLTIARLDFLCKGHFSKISKYSFSVAFVSASRHSIFFLSLKKKENSFFFATAKFIAIAIARRGHNLDFFHHNSTLLSTRKLVLQFKVILAKCGKTRKLLTLHDKKFVKTT